MQYPTPSPLVRETFHGTSGLTQATDRPEPALQTVPDNDRWSQPRHTSSYHSGLEQVSLASRGESALHGLARPPWPSHGVLTIQLWSHHTSFLSIQRERMEVLGRWRHKLRSVLSWKQTNKREQSNGITLVRWARAMGHPLWCEMQIGG